MLTEWHLERADRFLKATDVVLAVAILAQVIAAICLIVKIVIRDLFVLVHFSCGFGWVKAKVLSEDYGIPESVRMFAGDTAAEDCIRWAASKAVEVFDMVTARTAPYKDGMMKYKMALQGGNV